MDKLFEEATKLKSLNFAWQRIRSNGIRSVQSETRDAIKDFDQDSYGSIYKIQKLLRKNSFVFDPQKGVTKSKKSGSKRGIVMASVQNRIVERALLDCLQRHVPYVEKVISTETSLGGVPDRSVPHGIAKIVQAIQSRKYYIRSDITGFFEGIPRDTVINTLSRHIADKRFIKTLEQATTVTLGNEESLGEDRKLFPDDVDGVAQGSPLSPLFGNILLNDFDVQFNGRGIVCIRFIDDFVLLGDSGEKVKKAY